MVNTKELDTPCKSCGEFRCNCKKRIDDFNKTLVKCLVCELPIYEGMDHNHIARSKIERFQEEIEIIHKQRKKKLGMIIGSNIAWLIAVVYYVFVGMPIEVYVFGFLVFIVAIIFINKWYVIKTLPDWDDL